MFERLIQDLDEMEEGERQAACLSGLQFCAEHIERLSRTIEASRSGWLRDLSEFMAVDHRHLLGCPGARSLDESLGNRPEAEDVTLGLDELMKFVARNRAPSSSRRVGPERDAVAELLTSASRRLRPLLAQRCEVNRLSNALVYRLYSVSCAEAAMVSSALKLRET